MKMKMKTLLVFSLLLLLTSGCLCISQQTNEDSVNFLQTEGDVNETQRPSGETEEGEVFDSDIWDEVRQLRDMVVEQRVELRHLLARVTAAESRVEVLQKENTGTVSHV